MHIPHWMLLERTEIEIVAGTIPVAVLRTQALPEQHRFKPFYVLQPAQSDIPMHWSISRGEEGLHKLPLIPITVPDEARYAFQAALQVILSVGGNLGANPPIPPAGGVLVSGQMQSDPETRMLGELTAHRMWFGVAVY